MKQLVGVIEVENYWVKLYFGRDEDLLKLVINRSFRDFCRTMHGFGKIEPNKKSKIVSDFTRSIKKLFEEGIKTQEDFDTWHEKKCREIIGFFKENDFHDIHYGQAQKWINMTLKYIFLLGEERINGYEYLYEFAHVPIDNILIKELETVGEMDYKIKLPWSKMDKEEYSKFQKWFRNKSKKKEVLPIQYEFDLFLK